MHFKLSAMRKLLLSLLVVATASAQKKNTLLDAAFWKSNPTVENVRDEILKGNDPAEFDANAFDPVVLAINNGASNQVIKFLLQQKGNEGTQKITHDGRTFLHWATSRNNVELVGLLIEKGFDVNLKDQNGNTPLVYGSINGLNDPAIFDMFFAAGIDPKARYTNGATLMHISIASANDMTLPEYLVKKGLSLTETDQNGATVFDYAARTGKVANMRELVKRGVKPTDYALIVAAQGPRRSANTIEVFQYLLDDVKLNPNATNHEDENALHFVARKPNQDAIVAYLMQKGVNTNQVDKQGNTPLIRAASQKNLTVVKMLAEKTQNLNHVNAKGESALTVAVRSSSSAVVDYLLSKGAKPLIDREEKNLAYHLVQSYRAGDSEFIAKMNLLEQNGVDFTTPQKDGSTLYHVAVAKQDIALLDALKKFGINLNAIDKDGMTALHKAAMIAKDDKILKYLMAGGANPSIKTEFDETAFDLARENELLSKNKISIDFLK